MCVATAPVARSLYEREREQLSFFLSLSLSLSHSITAGSLSLSDGSLSDSTLTVGFLSASLSAPLSLSLSLSVRLFQEVHFLLHFDVPPLCCLSSKSSYQFSFFKRLKVNIEIMIRIRTRISLVYRRLVSSNDSENTQVRNFNSRVNEKQKHKLKFL